MELRTLAELEEYLVELGYSRKSLGFDPLSPPGALRRREGKVQLSFWWSPDSTRKFHGRRFESTPPMGGSGESLTRRLPVRRDRIVPKRWGAL